MVHRRGRQSVRGLCIVLVLLSLVLVQAGAQAQQAAGKAKVDRLVMGLITPYLDYWRPVDQRDCRSQHPARPDV